jgi:tetratricopeptide (TPR) repeat protein
MLCVPVSQGTMRLVRNSRGPWTSKSKDMSRTTRYKIIYFLSVSTAVAFAVLLTLSIGRDMLMAAGMVALILIIPGRVQGILYRELFRGRLLLEQQRELEAIDHLQRFLADVRARPWLKRMIWLSWSVYTPDVEAMTLNNIGAANLSLGRFEEAERAFGEALALDQEYPLPHFSMAVLNELRGNRILAEEALAESKKLGYVGGAIDAIISRAQSVLARVEGSGVKPA